jgi:hypothetical protein
LSELAVLDVRLHEFFRPFKEGVRPRTPRKRTWPWVRELR